MLREGEGKNSMMLMDCYLSVSNYDIVLGMAERRDQIWFSSDSVWLGLGESHQSCNMGSCEQVACRTAHRLIQPCWPVFPAFVPGHSPPSLALWLYNHCDRRTRSPHNDADRAVLLNSSRCTRGGFPRVLSPWIMSNDNQVLHRHAWETPEFKQPTANIHSEKPRLDSPRASLGRSSRRT
ncbi:uncharacterized protein BJX67DRAFT_244206 [Aspergillus lucknowensis]|uniref:Uncharacterized protein n=1 Tax=Aspergillus lucknowensis TaxID=176173 RepID=A0ABR4M1F1_9EURO